MRTAINALLIGDATLMAILTGGLYTTDEISRQKTPAAFDANSELRPCALLRLTSTSPTGPHYHSAQQGIELYLYQKAGYDQIDAAINRIYQLLHRQKVTPSAGTCWEIYHDNDTPDTEDSALQVALKRSRFIAYIGRPT